MRRGGDSPLPPSPPGSSDWAALRRLLPYLWEYKWRVLAALAFMVGAKVANVGVPVLLKNLVDALSLKPGDPMALLVVPAGLLLAYGTLVGDPIQLSRGQHLASQDKVRPHVKTAAAAPDTAGRQVAQANLGTAEGQVPRAPAALPQPR